MDRTEPARLLSPSSHDLFSVYTQKETEFWVSLPLLIRMLPIGLSHPSPPVWPHLTSNLLIDPVSKNRCLGRQYINFEGIQFGP